MFHQSLHSSPKEFPPNLSPQQKKEFTECLQRFQQASQALLEFYVPADPTRSHGQYFPCRHGEIRAYYVPPKAVQHEQKLLSHYNAADFHELFMELHMLLVGLVRIMKATSHGAKIQGSVVASLGHLLEPASSLAVRMKNVYTNLMFIKV